MVRPTRETLNKLAQLLRDVRPVYAECALIINDLAKKQKAGRLAESLDSTSTPEKPSANHHKAYIPLRGLEMGNKRPV